MTVVVSSPPGGSTVTAAAGVRTTLDIEATTGALLVSPRTRPPNMLVPPSEPAHRTWSAPSIRAEPLSSPLAKHNLPALRQVAERLGRDITDRTSSPSPRRVSGHKQQRRAPLVVSHRTNPIYKPLMCSVTRRQPGSLHWKGRVGFTDSAPDRHTTKQQGWYRHDDEPTQTGQAPSAQRHPYDPVGRFLGSRTGRSPASTRSNIRHPSPPH